MLRTDTNRVLLRFVEGRPISAVSITFLQWVCQQWVCQELQSEGKQALLLVWEPASWHISQQVKGWVQEHNARAKQAGGIRILSCLLPVKSPWLNPIEPHWVHAKRAIVEPEGKLTAQETRERVCHYFGCPCLDHITVTKEVA